MILSLWNDIILKYSRYFGLLWWLVATLLSLCCFNLVSFYFAPKCSIFTPTKYLKVFLWCDVHVHKFSVYRASQATFPLRPINNYHNHSTVLKCISKWLYSDFIFKCIVFPGLWLGLLTRDRNGFWELQMVFISTMVWKSDRLVLKNILQ